MEKTPSSHTDHARKGSATTPLTPLNVMEVDVEPIDQDVERPLIPADRKLSWLGWLAAIALFIVNRKLGLVFIILLLVFRQFPTLNLKHLPGKAGKLFKKLRG